MCNLCKVCLRFTHVKDCQGLSTLRNVHLSSSTTLSLIVVITIREFICSSVVRTIFRKLQIRKGSLDVVKFSQSTMPCAICPVPLVGHWSYSTPVLILCNKDWRPDLIAKSKQSCEHIHHFEF